MRTVEVTLAGQSYEIHELKARPNAAWRRQLQAVVGEAETLLRDAPNTTLTLPALAELVRQAQQVILNSPDTLRALVFEYAPELAEERERLEAEAYDSEFMAAFGEVLKLAFPFGGLLPILTGALKPVTGPS